MDKRRRYFAYFALIASTGFLVSCGDESPEQVDAASASPEVVTVTVTPTEDTATTTQKVPRHSNTTDTTGDRKESTAAQSTEESDLNAILEGRKAPATQDGREILPFYREQYGSNPELNTYTPTTKKLIVRVDPSKYRLVPGASCEGLDDGFRTYGPNESVLICEKDDDGRLIWDEE